MNDIHARVAVDATARRVVMYKGEHFEPNKLIVTKDSELPHKIAKITLGMKNSGDFENLTGKKFARFTVIGLSAEFKGNWVVRCSCGKYSCRTKKAINNTKNTQDRCEHCRHLAYLKRDEIWRRTGKEVNICDL